MFWFKRRAALIAELGRRLEEVIQLTRERDDARAQRDRLNVENVAKAAHIGELDAALASVKSDREALQAQVYGLQKECERWRKQYDEAQAELARLKAMGSKRKWKME